MSKPIKFMGQVPCTCHLKYEEAEVTYEELLDMFRDDCNFVRPLTLRCMELEVEVERLGERWRHCHVLLEQAYNVVDPEVEAELSKQIGEEIVPCKAGCATGDVGHDLKK